jgi:Tol biopolymer transport system component/DNA-binding winged helix-turn-helix (wHTH) protein
MEAAPEKAVRFYEFGAFVVDRQKCVLLRDGNVVPLTPKAFEILLVLIQNRGLVLEKDQLLKTIWSDTVVDENNLARNISALRKALGEAPGEHQYVVTVPGRGYRFVASVRDVEEDAEPIVEPVRLGQVEGHTRRRFVVAGALAAGLVIVATLLSWTTQQSRGRPPAQRRLWQLTFDPGLESEPAWSRDGHLLAYSSDHAGNFDIWVQPVADGKAIQVTSSPAHDWQPDWSPDGTRLVFRSERDGGGLFVVPALGGEERRISGFGYRPRWSPDGSQILFYSSILQNASELPKVYVVTPGSAARDVLGDLLKEFASLRVAWHPDGRRLSVGGRHRTHGWSFWTVPIVGGAAVKSEVDGRVAAQLAETAVTFTDFLWSPSGRLLYLEGISQGVKNLWKVEVDPETLRWVAGPERLTTGAGIDTDVALSPDGRKLALTIRTERTRLWSIPFDGAAGRVEGEGRPLAAGGMDAVLPDLSSDGRKLAFLALRGRKTELWGQSLVDGRTKELVVVGDFQRATPRWSRDGARLAYRRTWPPNAEGSPREHALVVLPAEGGDEQLITSPSPFSENALDWSADGEWLLGNSERQTPGRFLIGLFPTSAAPAAETKMRVVTSHPDQNLWQARFSPDERWISFIAVDANDAAIATLYVVPRAGGPWIRVTEGRYWDDKPRWAPDGRTLYFISNRAGFFNVWGVRFDPALGKPVGEPFRVTALESPGQIIVPYMTLMEMTLAADRLVVPIMEVSGGIWILENVEQ